MAHGQGKRCRIEREQEGDEERAGPPDTDEQPPPCYVSVPRAPLLAQSIERFRRLRFGGVRRRGTDDEPCRGGSPVHEHLS